MNETEVEATEHKKNEGVALTEENILPCDSAQRLDTDRRTWGTVIGCNFQRQPSKIHQPK